LKVWRSGGVERSCSTELVTSRSGTSRRVISARDRVCNPHRG
jgi:hypothetical protein